MADSMAVFALLGGVQAKLFYTSHAVLAEARRFATSTKSHIIVSDRTHHFLERQNNQKSFVLETTTSYKLYTITHQ